MDADDPDPKGAGSSPAQGAPGARSNALSRSSSSPSSSSSSSTSSVLGVFKKLGKAVKKAVVGSSKDKKKQKSDEIEDRVQSSSSAAAAAAAAAATASALEVHPPRYSGGFAAVASPSPNSSLLKGTAPVPVARAASDPMKRKAPRSLKQLYDDGFELAARAKVGEASGDLHLVGIFGRDPRCGVVEVE